MRVIAPEQKQVLDNPGQIMNTDEEYIEKVLFPGNACYPLSPLIVNKPHDPMNFNNQYDQNRLIMTKLGKLDEMDLSFIYSDNTINYVKKINSEIKTQPLNYLEEF